MHPAKELRADVCVCLQVQSGAKDASKAVDKVSIRISMFSHFHIC